MLVPAQEQAARGREGPGRERGGCRPTEGEAEVQPWRVGDLQVVHGNSGMYLTLWACMASFGGVGVGASCTVEAKDRRLSNNRRSNSPYGDGGRYEVAKSQQTAQGDWYRRV